MHDGGQKKEILHVNFSLICIIFVHFSFFGASYEYYHNAYTIEKPANNPSAVDAALFAKLKYFVQYAAAAYCTNNDDSSGTPITCATGNCPDVQAANAVSVLEFDR
jgi:hypothetical protein